jgi:hypothetical protein
VITPAKVLYQVFRCPQRKRHDADRRDAQNAVPMNPLSGHGVSLSPIANRAKIHGLEILCHSEEQSDDESAFVTRRDT